MKLIKPSLKYYSQYYASFKHLLSKDLVDAPFGMDPLRVSPQTFLSFLDEIKTEKGALKYENGAMIPSTTLWLIDNNSFVGQINIRHYLNDTLKQYGGHIGYFIREDAWGNGYGTKMFNLAIKYIKEHLPSIDALLLTINEENNRSRGVAENNGGHCLSFKPQTVHGKHRVTCYYWIDLRIKSKE